MDDQFDPIQSLEDISRILKIAEASSAEIYCEFVEAGKPSVFVELEIRQVSGSNVVLGIKRNPGSPAKLLISEFPNGLQTGAPIEVIFSLVDGQYAIRDVVQDVSLATFTLSAGRNLMRLQRRKDFRVSVKADGLSFAMNSKTKGSVTELSLIDLSAGGLRLLWPPTAGPIPAVGAVLSGSLKLTAKDLSTGKPKDGSTSEKSAAVDLKFVKDHGPDAPLKPENGHALSFQFSNLGQDEARAVLFTCMFVHRRGYGNR